MDLLSLQINHAIVQESKRRMIEESVAKIKKCLHLLSEEEIWYRPNENTVSIGNLVLHLCGNVRQWILSGIGNREDKRTRDQEFTEKGPLPTRDLMNNLDTLMAEVEEVLDELTPQQLVIKRKVQGHDETPVGILIHVVEHFSYHTGQIVYYVKSVKNIDLGFYSGKNLNSTKNDRVSD